MLPGLALTVGLVAQSIATLIPATPPNPNAPRFVNIGNDIIQSRTAKPVAPAAVCEPVAPAPPVEREIVIVPVAPGDAADATPPSEEPSADITGGGLLFFPFAASPFASRMHPRARTVARPQVGTMRPPTTVVRPSFPTVVLPSRSAPPIR